MNTLSKWNPFKKSDELDLLRPSLRTDPFRDMEDMMRSMQRAISQFPQVFQIPTRTEEAMTLAEWAPSVDIAESDTEFVVKAELPEMKKEDIKVAVEDGTLCISGERKVEKEEKDLRFHRVERAYGRFERSFTLPDGADKEKITSQYKGGILTVHLPKNPSAKPAVHQIEVK